MFGVAGCTKPAAPRDHIVALPADADDVVVVDANHLAVLRGTSQKAITILTLQDGSMAALFAVPDQTRSLAFAGPNALVDVLPGAHATLELRSLGGGLQTHVSLPHPILSVAGIDATRALVLVAGRPPHVAQVDFNVGRITSSVAAPAGAVTLAALASGLDSSLLVGTVNGDLYERIAGATTWQHLPVNGTQPAYSFSGSAMYAFQSVAGSKVVAVIAREYQLPVRLFAVSLDAMWMRAVDDGTVAIFERTPTAANVRLIACSSRLLAVDPIQKRSRFFGGGAPWQLLGFATPDPTLTQAPIPESTAGLGGGC
jgi:hypothetical protein